MTSTYVLIDFENVQVKSLGLLKGEEFQVRVFLGPNNKGVPTDLVIAMQHDLKERGKYIVLDAPGKNALDFYITYYLGRFGAKDPRANFIIISKDKGFDPLLRHLKTKNVMCSRYPSIDQIPDVKPKAPKAAPPAAPKKAKAKAPTPADAPLDALVKIAVTDLIKRKSAKPRTTKTLRNTIHNVLGKHHPLPMIDKVYAALLKQGLVLADGTKVSSYNLPAE